MPFSRCSRHVEAIDKRHQNLTSFPDDIIRYYRTLEELFLNSNQLHELPKGFYKLTQLRKLDISDNEIERISHEIGNFVNLVEFDCNRNDIQEFPDSIRYLRNLQVLDISNNPLQSLPTGLTQLKALTELTLNDLSLPYLPEDIGGLVNLRSLQARDNLLKSIPDSLCTIPKLESLDLGSNEIEEIPNNIGKLANLKVLWLDLNQIKSVPSEIGRLKKLQYLELSENMLETLPDEIAGCTGLTDINLAQNSIEYIPSTVGQLANLSILKLEQNQLVVLTPQIGQCTQLSELVLTENLLSEVPASLGNLKVLTNLNIDRNRLTYLPNEICECENLGLLFVRDNQLSKLPEQLGKLQKLRVLDVAGNRLAYLPASLAQANLNAIWLAENQATGKVKLQPDFDEETQKEVLTCYLLPQQNFHTPSMENLLQGSINTNTENASQGGLLQQQAAETPSLRQATSESVRFAPESDNEEKPSHFVRTNTPHPKELAKKKEALKQRSTTVSNTTSTVTANGITTTIVSSSKVQFEHTSKNENDDQQTPQQLPVINSKLLNTSNNDDVQTIDEPVKTTNKTSTSPRMNQIKFPPSKNKETSRESEKTEIRENQTETDHENDSEQQRNLSNGHYKHVDFKINDIKTIPNDQEENEDEEHGDAAENDESVNTSSNHCRLRRRDTPHHLKGARINTTTNPAQQLDPIEMREILERYQSSNQTSPKSVPISPTNGHQQENSPQLTNGNSTQSFNKEKPASIYVPENFKYDDLRKQVQLVIHINREEGAGLGIRIAGGKGSLNPYKDDDDGIFITRILPDSPALKTGLKVGDKLLKVNQICLDDLTHQEAADALREAVKLGTQLTLSVLQELDMNKLYFLKIPSLNEQGMSEYVEKHSTTSGFKINYNFNTIQQREVEIIFVGDHKRFAQLKKSDILLQINGKNIDDMSEKDLNKFVANSSNPKASNEFCINFLTIYRPYIQEEQFSTQSELIDDCCEHDRDGHQNNRNSNGNDSQNNPSDEHDEHNDSKKSNDSYSNGQNTNITNGLSNHQSATITTPIVQSEAHAKRAVNSLIDQQQQTPKLLNNPISSSTPMRNKHQESAEVEFNQNGSNGNGNLEEEEDESIQKQQEINNPHPIEEIFIKKVNGAMGLSIVGGGNFACHPFGVNRPGIFISKIVGQGPASNTNLRVGDRLLKVNGVDVTNMTHDETVEELKQNSEQVILLVSHDPQPAGMQEVILNRSFPEETLGIRINGGIENKSANPFDTSDEGIFVVNLIQGTLAHRDGRLRVGTRIMEVSKYLIFHIHSNSCYYLFV
jgi:protein scribble